MKTAEKPSPCESTTHPARVRLTSAKIRAAHLDKLLGGDLKQTAKQLTSADGQCDLLGL